MFYAHIGVLFNDINLLIKKNKLQNYTTQMCSEILTIKVNVQTSGLHRFEKCITLTFLIR
jgi:hypothetical protein